MGGSGRPRSGADSGSRLKNRTRLQAKKGGSRLLRLLTLTFYISTLKNAINNHFLIILSSDADPDPWIRICIIKSDPNPDSYGEIQIRIQDINGNYAETYHGKK